MASGQRGSAAHHVLVAAADVGGDDLQDGAVVALALLSFGLYRAGGGVQLQRREGDTLDLDMVGAHEDHAPVGGSRRGTEISFQDGLSPALAAAAACLVVHGGRAALVDHVRDRSRGGCLRFANSAAAVPAVRLHVPGPAQRCEV